VPGSSEYYGYFVGDRKNGVGVLKCLNDVYVGCFVNDKKQGHGQFYESDKGTLYEGNWDDDKKRGEGTLRLEDGRKIKGRWENNNKYIPIV